MGQCDCVSQREAQVQTIVLVPLSHLCLPDLPFPLASRVLPEQTQQPKGSPHSTHSASAFQSNSLFCRCASYCSPLLQNILSPLAFLEHTDFPKSGFPPRTRFSSTSHSAQHHPWASLGPHPTAASQGCLLPPLSISPMSLSPNHNVSLFVH